MLQNLKKNSDVARDAFVSVVKSLKGTEQMRSVMQKLMIKAVGERSDASYLVIKIN